MMGAGSGRWALRAFAALVLPVLALAGHPAMAAAQETVFDHVVWAFPTGERVGAGPGNCIEIGSGKLDIWVGLAGGADVGPIEFMFSGYGGRDPGSKIETIVNRNGSSYSMDLAGGIYCYSVYNRAYIDLSAPPQLITDLGQAIGLRM